MKQEIKKYKSKDTSFANNSKGQLIYIDDAESGRNGYYCRGKDCLRELVAVKCSDRMSYFRHYAQDVDHNGSCSFSNETERHRIGKEILQRLKKVKVPNLYKEAPEGLGLPKLLIHKSKTIHAHSVGNERRFYIDECGNVTSDNKEHRYQIVPDVTFFNKQGDPILFIELVVTHRISKSKYNLLKKFAVDTIQVSIPKGSPETIEQAFNVTTHTKWIYNYEQEITEYIYVPRNSGEGAQEVDEYEGILYKEFVACRTNRIRTLIRQIGKSIRSEHYKKIERGLNDELSRVEENRERKRREIDELKVVFRERTCSFKESRERLERIHRKRYSEINEAARKTVSQRFGEEEKRISKEEEEFENYSQRLEKRYFTKRKELEYQEEQFDREEIQLSDAIESDRTIKFSIEKAIEDSKTSIRACKAAKNILERIKTESRKKETEEEGILKRMREENEQSQNRIRAEFDEKERKLFETISNGNSEFLRNSEILRLQQLVSDFIDVENDEKKMQALIRIARKRAFQKRSKN